MSGIVKICWESACDLGSKRTTYSWWLIDFGALLGGAILAESKA